MNIACCRPVLEGSASKRLPPTQKNSLLEVSLSPPIGGHFWIVIVKGRPITQTQKKDLRAGRLIPPANEEALFDADSQREYPTRNCNSERFHRGRCKTGNLIFV